MNGEKTGSRVFKIIWTLAILVIIALLFSYASTFPSRISFNAPPSIFKPTKEVSILVVGDIMLDRNVLNKINVLGFDEYFSGVKELVSYADIAVANLEGPFTTFPSVTSSLVSKELKFTFDPKFAPELARLGFDVLGLANNHTLNFGKEGLDMTREYIKSTGMWYYGDPDNKDELSVVIEKNGIKVGFVGFHEFSYKNFDKVLAEISKIRLDVDFLIVTPHWGIEYQKESTENMKKWAHEFIDHGADVVIGAHPHVVGDIEEYNGKKIFYSLGNFAFDQYFSEDTMTGLGVLMEVGKDSQEIKYNLINIKIDKKGPSVY